MSSRLSTNIGRNSKEHVQIAPVIRPRGGVECQILPGTKVPVPPCRHAVLCAGFGLALCRAGERGEVELVPAGVRDIHTSTESSDPVVAGFVV
jgi:hypothetical protein